MMRLGSVGGMLLFNSSILHDMQASDPLVQRHSHNQDSLSPNFKNSSGRDLHLFKLLEFCLFVCLL